jgi:hypothetical protein
MEQRPGRSGLIEPDESDIRAGHRTLLVVDASNGLREYPVGPGHGDVQLVSGNRSRDVMACQDDASVGTVGEEEALTEMRAGFGAYPDRGAPERL